jgi:pectate lyase
MLKSTLVITTNVSIFYLETTSMYTKTIEVVQYLETRFENISIRLPKDRFVEVHVTGPYIRQYRVFIRLK